jgi:hypothetical protein
VTVCVAAEVRLSIRNVAEPTCFVTNVIRSDCLNVCAHVPPCLVNFMILLVVLKYFRLIFHASKEDETGDVP